MQETETTQQPFPLHEIIEELIQQLSEKYVSRKRDKHGTRRISETA
jgi:hypothetical protein